jgi:hypothetical protein
LIRHAAGAATITLSGTPTRNVGVATLCRVPGANGALTPTFNPHAHVATQVGAKGWLRAADLCG